MEARAAPARPGWIMDGFTYNDDWLVVVVVHVVAGEGVNRTSRGVSILKAFSTCFSIGRFASSLPSPDHHSPSCPSSTVYSCPSCSLLRNSWSRRRSACSPVSVSKTLILVSQTFIPTTGVTSFTALMDSSSNNNNRFLAMISWYVCFLVFPLKTLLTMLLLLKPPDAQALANLSFPLPENTLESVAGACGRVFSPFCRFIGSTLNSDVETLIQSLHEADPDFAVTANGKYTVQVCPPILSPFGFNIS